jgi:predicted enzyme related to lactoylglutathione lyase
VISTAACAKRTRQADERSEAARIQQGGNNGHGIGGGIGPSRDGRNSITFYLETEDLKGTLAKVEKLGGKTVMPPTKAGPVELAMFADPEGNVIGLAKGM